MKAGGREVVFDGRGVKIVRLGDVPRSGVDGRHRLRVGYVGPTMTTAELVRLLRDSAEALAKSLPRLPQS